jgi:hypothetical protein
MTICETAEDLYQLLIKNQEFFKVSGIIIFNEGDKDSPVEFDFNEHNNNALDIYGIAESISWYIDDQQYFTSMPKNQWEIDYKYLKYCNTPYDIFEFLNEIKRDELIIKLYSPELCKYFEDDDRDYDGYILLAVYEQELRIFGDLF